MWLRNKSLAFQCSSVSRSARREAPLFTMAPKKGGKAAKEEAADAPAQSAWEVRLAMHTTWLLQAACSLPTSQGGHVPCIVLFTLAIFCVTKHVNACPPSVHRMWARKRTIGRRMLCMRGGEASSCHRCVYMCVCQQLQQCEAGWWGLGACQPTAAVSVPGAFSQHV